MAGEPLLNGSTTVATLDIFEDDGPSTEALATPPDREDAVPDESDEPAHDTEPEVEIVEDDDEDAEQKDKAPKPEATTVEEPTDEEVAAWKREVRKELARSFTNKVRRALNGELSYDQLSSSERRAYQDLDSWRKQVETPVRQSAEERVWAEYQEMWQAERENPQRFNALWMDATRREAYKQMQAHRATLGLDPQIDPRTFREAFDQYNAQFQPDPGAGTEADDFYEDIQETRTWREMTDAEKESLHPRHFQGSPQQQQVAMARRLGRVEAEVALRRKQKPVEERVAEVNKTAVNARAAAQKAAPGVPRGAPVRMTVSEIRKLAAQGDPQGMRLYQQYKERRKAAS